MTTQTAGPDLSPLRSLADLFLASGFPWSGVGSPLDRCLNHTESTWTLACQTLWSMQRKAAKKHKHTYTSIYVWILPNPTNQFNTTVETGQKHRIPYINEWRNHIYFMWQICDIGLGAKITEKLDFWLLFSRKSTLDLCPHTLLNAHILALCFRLQHKTPLLPQLLSTVHLQDI